MSDFHREELERMYNELTDDELIEQNKRKTEREKRIEDRRKDTGYE